MKKVVVAALMVVGLGVGGIAAIPHHSAESSTGTCYEVVINQVGTIHQLEQGRQISCPVHPVILPQSYNF